MDIVKGRLHSLPFTIQKHYDFILEKTKTFTFVSRCKDTPIFQHTQYLKIMNWYVQA